MRVDDPAPRIFRPAAVRHYARSRAETVTPRFASPRIFVVLWVLLALLLAGTALAWLARVPVYSSTVAVAVRGSGAPGDVLVAALVPPGEIGRLRVGQTLLLDLGGQQGRHPQAGTRRRIIALDRTIRSPEALRRRFDLQSGAALAVTGPAAIAYARLEPLPGGTPASRYLGSMYAADLETGSTRVLALVPVVGGLFGG
ncbi:MAG: hypothetical protein JOZ41_20860 [Chloroflexi bacterium]|nr:hypothetical protein [Chloroflexota bacterium]